VPIPTRTAALLAAALGLAACGEAERPPAARLAAGHAALAQENAGAARVHYLNALASAGTDPAIRTRAHLGLARASLAVGDGVGAEADLVRARASGATAAAIGTADGEALLLQGRHDAALVALRAIPAAHAAEANRLAAAAHLGRGDAASARGALEKAAALAPASIRTLLDLSALRFALGDRDGALFALNQARALDPTDADYMMLAGSFASELEGPRAALIWYDRAVAAAPHAIPPRIARANALAALGRSAEASRLAAGVLASSPDHPEALFVQAQLAARGRDFERARQLLGRIGRRLDDRVGTPLLAAQVDAGLGNRAAAVARLEKLVAARPSDRTTRAILSALQAGS
jgi:Tfp pilus assembly protein PilF